MSAATHDICWLTHDCFHALAPNAVRRQLQMTVPFIDLRKVNARYLADDILLRVMASGRYLNGVEVETFEHQFAEFCGTGRCVSLANGLDALRLTLLAWMSLGRLSPGDEVLVPANSFVASALAVTECGLRLGLIDVDPATFNVTPETVEKAITARSRVVMPVHLYGQLAPMREIAAICKRNGLLVLEDSAQAHGALQGGIRAGAFGDAGAFSFYPTKNLGALGDAGGMTTNDAALAERVRALGNYGSATKYRHDHLGTNSRMDEIQAAFLSRKLQYLDDDNQIRRGIARRYLDLIHNPRITLPAMPADPLEHVWHLFVVTCRNRDALAMHLETHQIQTIVHYPAAIHRQPAYSALPADWQLPVSTRLQDEVLSLPISPVMEESQVDSVIDAVNRWNGT